MANHTIPVAIKVVGLGLDNVERWQRELEASAWADEEGLGPRMYAGGYHANSGWGGLGLKVVERLDRQAHPPDWRTPKQQEEEEDAKEIYEQMEERMGVTIHD